MKTQPTVLELAMLTAAIYPTLRNVGHPAKIAIEQATNEAWQILQAAEARIKAGDDVAIAPVPTRPPLLEPTPEGARTFPGSNPSHQPPQPST